MISLLKVENLSKKQGQFQLSDINLELEAGKIMGVIGVNGSGKTTMMNTIINLYNKDSGKVLINGHSMSEEEREAKDGLGLVLDEEMFENTLTCRRNGLLYGKWYKRFDEGLFFQLCDRFQIPVDKKLGSLSTGYKMRFQLAFALSHNAKLFLMDEPSAGLDTSFRKTLIGCMEDLVRGKERAVIFSTHITEDLEDSADYIVMIHDGKILFCMEKEKLMNYFILLEGTEKDIEGFSASSVIFKEYGKDRSFIFARRIDVLALANLNEKRIYLDDIMYYLEEGLKYDKDSVIRSLD